MSGKFLTPKALANKMKAKGLQKLRWYCQSCQKQCRDDNGFKCHLASEGHQRQMLLFSENAGRVVADYSKEFLHDFLGLLSTRFGAKRVHINTVYQEYIRDRHHTHMNATHWSSLTGLARFLERQDICGVEETEDGYFLTWIDRSPETLARQEAEAKRARMQKSEEEREQKILEEQIRRAHEAAPEAKDEFTELKRDESDAPIKLDLKLKPTASSSKDGAAPLSLFKKPDAPAAKRVNPLKAAARKNPLKETTPAKDDARKEPLSIPPASSANPLTVLPFLNRGKEPSSSSSQRDREDRNRRDYDDRRDDRRERDRRDERDDRRDRERDDRRRRDDRDRDRDDYRRDERGDSKRRREEH